jgi:ammonia channel protein AmtB
MNEDFFIFSLIALSLILFLVSILLLFFKGSKKKYQSINQILMLPAVFLYASIVVHRFIICYYKLDFLELATENGIVSFFNAMIRAMQTFSLDEDYIEAIVTGEEILAMVLHSKLQFAFTLLFTIQNVCAPIMTGAFLIDVLSSFFPRLKLLFIPFREKYVFSELNERAIFLAEDIIEKFKEKKKNRNEE